MIETKIKTATILNIDCMEYMRRLPDKHFDLAVCDPPYGIGISNNPVRQMHSKKTWDGCIPKQEYFNNLTLISANQVIWGGNYFIDYLKNTKGFLIWDKVQPHDFSLAMCEFAWTSIQKPAKIFQYPVLSEKNKIHPTQKPVKLYEWILTNYAKPGQTIFDSHMGSGSSAIAAINLGFEYVGCELDADYYAAACKRITEKTMQERLFV